MRKLTLLMVVAAALPSLGATGGDGGCGPGDQVTRDPGFDLWCGDQLCSWKVVSGEVTKAPTWHEKDAGVAFLGAEAAIAQTTPVDSYDGTCLRFSLISRSDANVELTLSVDVFGDGTAEHTERFPTGPWQKLSYDLKLTAPYRGVRFAITKRGDGEATVAQIDVKTAAGGCAGFTPIVAVAPIGGLCGAGEALDNAVCGSGLCVSNNVSDDLYAAVCTACAPGATPSTCAASEVCGQIEPGTAVREPAFACIAKHSDPVGAMCRTDEECDSGVCNNHVCSTCRTSDHPCANSESCALAYDHGPTMCMPGSGVRASGSPCATDADCASGTCDGTARYQCADGRSCGNADRELCPPPPYDGTSSTLEPGACTLVGVEGGTCH